MQFVSLSPAEFKIFADQHPQKSFFQTEQIAKVRQKNGWKPYYFGIKDKNDSLLAILRNNIDRDTGHYDGAWGNESKSLLFHRTF